MSRSFLSLTALAREEFQEILTRALDGKRNKAAWGKPLTDKCVALFFEKPSTRTRISFEVAVVELGGYPLILTQNDLQLSRGEEISDTARVMARYVNAIMARVKSHSTLESLAAHARIPVINGLSDKFHPCQALADFLTLKENGIGKGAKLVFVGDGSSNVAHSLLIGSAHYGCEIVIATPENLLPSADVLTIAARLGGQVTITQNVLQAAKDADVLYTDVWVSMGEEAKAEQKKENLKKFQLNEEVLSYAKKSAIILHCLPAHKGEEITEAVFESPMSRIFDQAENRLHTQKAVLEFFLK
ncbi:MAG: Ornithine carbamoyltransferase [Turneriella sp.]|nr:Ornithine carbamoyltransferase [Turneriella sp.]